MANVGREKSPPQQAPVPQPQDNRPFGERRPPEGDRAKYDKHGGNLDTDGKHAKSQGPPNKRKQDREEGLPPEAVEESGGRNRNS
jgi:hypothetical protein